MCNGGVGNWDAEAGNKKWGLGLLLCACYSSKLEREMAKINADGVPMSLLVWTGLGCCVSIHQLQCPFFTTRMHAELQVPLLQDATTSEIPCSSLCQILLEG